MNNNTNPSQDEANYVVFFDGLCPLCDGFVRWLLAQDKDHQFRFASLQGSTAKASLPLSLIETLSSVVLKKPNGELLTESSAIFFILKQLGKSSSSSGARILSAFSILPRPITDVIYRWVARHRTLLTGRKSACRLPSAEEKSFFLD